MLPSGHGHKTKSKKSGLGCGLTLLNCDIEAERLDSTTTLQITFGLWFAEGSCLVFIIDMMEKKKQRDRTEQRWMQCGPPARTLEDSKSIQKLQGAVQKRYVLSRKEMGVPAGEGGGRYSWGRLAN